MSAVNEHHRPQQQVDLASQRLALLSLRRFTATDTVTLSLADNLLATLPAQFASSLTHLRYLNLKQNNFKLFPPALTQLRSLEILDLSRNKLKSMPESLGNLHSTLKVFSIAKNHIQFIPPYMGTMSQLNVLKLDGNPFQWPPSDVIALAIASSDDRSGLVALKEYLQSHSMPDFSFPSSPLSDRMSILSVIPLESQQTTTGSTTMPASCVEAVESHLRNSTGTPSPIKSILQASATLHTAVSRIHRSQPPTLKDAPHFLPTHLDALAINILSILEALTANDTANASAAPPPVSAAAMRQAILDLVDAQRSLIALVINGDANTLAVMRTKTEGMDMRVARAAVADLHAAQMDIFEAVERMGETSTVAGPDTGMWRFRNRKEAVRLAEEALVRGKDALEALSGVGGFALCAGSCLLVLVGNVA
ncbi:hypothetical protein BC830DRAFT_1120285 [Chytriomyces sp. MP71]|nr:hypothetical protein BC830DRAFT_1120285 [Chytriomyces sp. MP71]